MRGGDERERERREVGGGEGERTGEWVNEILEHVLYRKIIY